jgi:hypothetical protein
MRTLRAVSSTLLAFLALALAASSPAMAEARTSSTSAEDHKALLERIQQRLDQIEGKIVLAKEKVDVLRDTVLTGQATRTRVVITHRNEMGTGFVLEKATYTLDGEILFNKEDPSGGLDAMKEFELFNGSLPPGSHEITVALVLTGSSYGVFTYLKGYKFKVDSKWRFSATDGRLTRVAVVSYAKGDITTSTSEKIAVRYDLDINAVGPSAEGAGGAAGENKPAEAKPAESAQPPPKK